MIIKDIYQFLDSIYPFNYTDSIDNTGLLIGNMDASVERIMLALDITHSIIDEAIEKKINLIITHHPVIFHKIGKIEGGSIVARLVKQEINVISAHTNADMAVGGISDIMLEMLGFDNTKCIIEPVYGEIGYGRIGISYKEFSPEELADYTKRIFGTAHLRYVSGGKPIKKIAVSSGSSGSLYEKAAKLGADAYITGDVKWDQFVGAVNMGFTLIDAGHFETENIILSVMKEQLQNKFENIQIVIAQNNKNIVR